MRVARSTRTSRGNVKASRPGTVGLGVCLAALLLLGQPALGGETALAAKTDKLAISAAKGDLLDPRPDTTETIDAARPAAASAPFSARGPVARKMIDVALRDGGLWLNSFATRTMPLDAPACAALSNEIVSSLPVGAVERLADEHLMRQTRVCALNGSLLLTCYGGTATVSLRPLKHRDGCGG